MAALSTPSYRVISSLMDIADHYDLFLIDLWGVTHDGQTPFASAISVYQQLKALEKTLIILSNAPRLPAVTLKRLGEMGMDPTLFDGVMTSGVDCNAELYSRTTPFYQELGPSFYHIGPQRDVGLFEDVPFFQKVEQVSDAHFLLVTGTEGWDENTDSYHPLLEQALKRNLPMICANADKTVFVGDKRVICAGAIAAKYQEMGSQKILVHGKPNPSVFKAAHDLGSQKQNRDIPKSRVLMLGDSLATDINGANRYGIDSVFTLTGVHKNTSPADWSSLFADYQAFPTYVMPDGIA